MIQTDRRQQRSLDPLIALHFQLAHVRSAAALDAIVVADPSGVVVAGAGSWAACEELAAYAPLLAVTSSDAEDVGYDAAGSRIGSLRTRATVVGLCVDSREVLLCCIGGDARSSAIERAAVGVTRILKAA